MQYGLDCNCRLALFAACSSKVAIKKGSEVANSDVGDTSIENCASIECLLAGKED